jgi:hypothetical protein
LISARQESGHIDEGQNRNVEGIQVANEARSFDGGIDVQAAGQIRRVIGNDLVARNKLNKNSDKRQEVNF